jgi:hypothetical protein
LTHSTNYQNYQLTTVAAVGPDARKTRVAAFAGVEYQFGSVTVLNARRMHEHTQQETVGIDEKMSLSSFDTLSRIITNSVLFFRPFFSAVLTDWLSRTAAEGVGSRPALTRRRSRSTS